MNPVPLSTASSSPETEPRSESPGAPLLECPPSQAARLLRSLDWSFEDASPRRDVHALHPYPAKFIAELPRQVISCLSEPGDLVVDPFSGGGTAAVEALVAGRGFFGIDANPIGNAVARAKTARLSQDDLSAMRRVERQVMAADPEWISTVTPSWLPDIPNLDKWYDQGVFHALGVIRELILEAPTEKAGKLALIAFVQAAAKLSFQESETRYVSKRRDIDTSEVPKVVLGEIRRVRQLAEDLSRLPVAEAEFIDGDARKAASFAIDPDSAGLIVTSPPYPNTFDYHLYHRFRLFWLGEDPKELRRIEIGSHLKNQAIEDPIGAYLDDMGEVLRHSYEALAPGRYAVFVVGDGLFKGEVFKTAPALTDRARRLGFDHVATIDRPLPNHRRSVTKPGRRLLEEQILFLRKPQSGHTATAFPPNYSLHPYEEDLLRRELDALGGSPQQMSDGRLAVVPTPHVDSAAFVHLVEDDGGDKRPSTQCRLEGAVESSSRRKNSSYAGHGIHRYKGKFYPQLAKSLLNLSGLGADSVVVDPFGGSGTVATEAALAGIDAVSFDCNPVAAAIARAKTATVGAGAAQIAATIAEISERVERAPAQGSSALSQFGRGQMKELRSWFPPPVLAKLDWLLGTIRTHTDGDTTTVLEVLVSDLIREVSQQDPKDLRIRRRKEPLRDAPVYDPFLLRARTLEKKIRAYVENVGAPTTSLQPKIETICADAADPGSFDLLAGREIDAIVSSPPYAAALPYIDTDRLSLAAVFGVASSARRDLERTMIGSREIGKREQSALERELVEAGETDLPESTLTFLSRFASAVAADSSAGFRRRQAPAVLLRYFAAMGAVLGNLAAHTRRGAPCWLVLGDSRSTVGGRTWTIPTVNEVAAIAARNGFDLVDRLPITVTREDVVHTRHAITRNEILQLEFRGLPRLP
ncbi:MAG TPA: DNA methyltransferase [Solirubrobacterales bacterium]|nr:DNA methyltransferase [Solirubrobacterales bacterium]